MNVDPDKMTRTIAGVRAEALMRRGNQAPPCLWPDDCVMGTGCTCRAQAAAVLAEYEVLPRGELEDRLARRKPKTGAKHPDTSRDAAAIVHAESDRGRLLLLLRMAHEGRGGLTAREATGLLDYHYSIVQAPNQVAARLLELREDGFVYRTDVKRKAEGGRAEGYVQRLTEKGLTLAARLAAQD